MGRGDETIVLVDWGTTNFRAYLLDSKGQCVGQKATSQGIAQIRGDFESILTANIGPWLARHPKSRVILSGMIGSQIGWKDTPYIDCPTSVADYGRHCLRVHEYNSGNCWIVPGVRWVSNDGAVDVMRGEELQIIGASHLMSEERTALFCCPGTHTKWVSLESGSIRKISTSMTGELYSLLSSDSILAKSIDTHAGIDDDAFRAGVLYSHRSGGLLNHLFSVRTQFLSGNHGKAYGASYLSGLLIGHEIQGFLGSHGARMDNPCRVIGSSSLCELYQKAMGYFSMNSTIVRDKSASTAGAKLIVQTLESQ